MRHSEPQDPDRVRRVFALERSGLSLESIGAKLGISKAAVCRTLKRWEAWSNNEPDRVLKKNQVEDALLFGRTHGYSHKEIQARLKQKGVEISRSYLTKLARQWDMKKERKPWPD